MPKLVDADAVVGVPYNKDRGYFVPVMDLEGHICYILCSVCGSRIVFTPSIEDYRFCPLCGHPIIKHDKTIHLK